MPSMDREYDKQGESEPILRDHSQPCEHGEVRPHRVFVPLEVWGGVGDWNYEWCPSGRVVDYGTVHDPDESTIYG